jgi:hypothetical protein
LEGQRGTWYLCKFVRLKKLLAIFLLLQIGSGNALAEELLKTPALFTHYQHHARHHNDVSGFLDFLAKHYATGHGVDDDDAATHGEQDSDCNLPFRHCGDCGFSFHQSITAFPSTLGTSFEYGHPAIQFSTEDEDVLSLELCDIWQPPKIA